MYCSSGFKEVEKNALAHFKLDSPLRYKHRVIHHLHSGVP